MAATARDMLGALNPQYLNAIAIAASEAIADTGATLIFIMEGTRAKTSDQQYARSQSIYPTGQK
jgi:hypothetical protein